MSKMPFELEGHEAVEGGVLLTFRCVACGGPVRLAIPDKDTLQERYPMACPCGAEANLVFGSPKIGRAILRRLKSSAGEPHACRSPLLN
jgi:hypothetical protein